MNIKLNFKRASILSAVLVTMSVPSYADDLQRLSNMERERAELVSAFFEHDLNNIERQQRIENSERRLLDLEQMVMRDDRLLGNTDDLVMLAFSNYDLSFISHASSEAGQVSGAFWLNQVGFSNRDLLSTNVVRR